MRYSPDPDMSTVSLGILINTGFIGILIFTLLIFDLVLHTGSCWLSSVLSQGCGPLEVDKKLLGKRGEAN